MRLVNAGDIYIHSFNTSMVILIWNMSVQVTSLKKNWQLCIILKIHRFQKVSQKNYCIKNLDGQERSSRKNHVGFTIDSSYTSIRIINWRNGVQASVKNHKNCLVYNYFLEWRVTCGQIPKKDSICYLNSTSSRWFQKFPSLKSDINKKWRIYRVYKKISQIKNLNSI